MIESKKGYKRTQITQILSLFMVIGSLLLIYVKIIPSSCFRPILYTAVLITASTLVMQVIVYPWNERKKRKKKGLRS